MPKRITYFLNTIILLLSCVLFSQAKYDNPYDDSLFSIRGSVYEKGSYNPYKDVTILINGGSYTTTNFEGNFIVKAKIGDQLTVMHNEFKTIYYTITSNERIIIEVKDDETSSKPSKYKTNIQRFNTLIDSADAHFRTDATKSVQFITEALNTNPNDSQSVIAHELLGDVYYFWKQYDLAISAYKISIQNEAVPAIQLKLAKAYYSNKELALSIATYNSIKKRKLSNYDSSVLYEGLGDCFLNMKSFVAAITAYQDGLTIAKKHRITSKITDLNSKIAQAYSLKGETIKAEKFFNNSLNLAGKENKKRAIVEQVIVAEFNSANANYDTEIVLRKQAIEGIKTIKNDTLITNASAITLQKQNYKIGNAYLLKNDVENAIPYFEKSIEEADQKKDLIVEKDATRKLSEALIKKGDTKKGIAMIENYKNIVDALYIKKEQELSQVALLNRNLTVQQTRIASLESERALSQSKYELSKERNKRQQLIIYSLIGGLTLLLIFGYFLFKYIKQQRLANNLLALKSLRSQMNPHFIFNALNSVNSFIAINDERTANKYLTDFSRLMRTVLENSEEDFIPLQKEVELLELYTKLEHFRFQDKFDYAITISDDIDIDAFKIPPMLLQPYIENAVWHGLRYKSEKGHLQIAMQPKQKDEITITITDNGIGRKQSKALKTAHQKKQNSKGMHNIKKRVAILNTMYKDKVDVSISDVNSEDTDTGTKVIVTLKKY